ncbi:MAG: transcriptional repressor [Arcobacteraceae bacterium]|nr:transcriptional repressor [Arcobacteraceae bacterium]
MKKGLTITYDEYMLKFKGLIKSLGLNNSVQREYVLKILFDCDNHLSAEDIAKKVKDVHNINIGIATVYRILALLEELNIIKGISIDGFESKVYELNLTSHHDHMVCVECGKIVEFYDAEVEKIQELVAIENGFKLQSHNMMLYGICKDCQEHE